MHSPCVGQTDTVAPQNFFSLSFVWTEKSAWNVLTNIFRTLRVVEVGTFRSKPSSLRGHRCPRLRDPLGDLSEARISRACCPSCGCALKLLRMSRGSRFGTRLDTLSPTHGMSHCRPTLVSGIYRKSCSCTKPVKGRNTLSFCTWLKLLYMKAFMGWRVFRLPR